jgi:membrane fusion protein (multidrug efflux system)
VKINAISRQDYENAVTTAQQARADVAAQQALLRSAEIDLARTTIRAPISGRIGRSTYTTGALVSASQTDALTTIQRLDPIFVDIQQSSADVLRLRQQLLAGDLTSASGNVAVKLKLEDGSTYPQEGVLKFTDVTVDPTTGSQIIRAQFPNPKGLLLPGMYVRAEFAQATKANGLLRRAIPPSSSSVRRTSWKCVRSPPRVRSGTAGWSLPASRRVTRSSSTVRRCCVRACR